MGFGSIATPLLSWALMELIDHLHAPAALHQKKKFPESIG
jgi:hypothetical protein